jgi:hypothetical protein
MNTKLDNAQMTVGQLRKAMAELQDTDAVWFGTNKGAMWRCESGSAEEVLDPWNRPCLILFQLEEDDE